MKSFDNTHQLEEFGIDCLTGEACGVGLRVLADVTEEGRTLLREFFRMDVASAPWNGGVGSVMLPYSCLEDLWVFANVRAGKAWVFKGGYLREGDLETCSYETGHGETVSYEVPKSHWRAVAFVCDTDEDVANVQMLVDEKFFYVKNTYRKSTCEGTGLDNEHRMSGRTR